MRKRITDDKENTNYVIDLASALKEAQDESKTYICIRSGSDLVFNKTYKFMNPFRREGYYCANINTCPSFGKVLYVSLVKPKVKPRPVKGVISNLRDASQEVMTQPITKDKRIGIEGCL